MALQCLEIQISSRKILSSKDDILGTPVMSSGFESTTELKEIQLLSIIWIGTRILKPDDDIPRKKK